MRLALAFAGASVIAGCIDRGAPTPPPPLAQRAERSTAFPDDAVLQRLADMGAWIDTGAFAKEAKDYKFTIIKFVDKTLGSATLRDVAHVKHLEGMEFVGCGFEDGALRGLRSLPNSVDLSFERCKLRGGVLAELDGSRSVRLLNFARMRVTDEDFAGLISFPQLSGFEISSDGVSADGLGFLARCRSLRELSLSHAKINDDTVEAIVDGHDLFVLDLTGTNITDAALTTVSQRKNLRWLKLGDCHITDEGVARLQGLSSLELLDLGATLITNDSMRSIGKIKNLRDLNVASTAVSDAGLHSLSALKHLRWIGNARTGITWSEVRNALGRHVTVDEY